MAILKPSPGLPISAAAGTRQLSKRRRASGCGAITVEAFGDGEAGIVGRDDEGREAARARRLAGAGEHHVEVGDAAVRDPGLLAVEHVIRRRRAARSWRCWRRRSRRPARSARRRRSPCRRGCAAARPRAAPSCRTARSARRRGPAWRRRSRRARRGAPASRARARACARRAARRPASGAVSVSQPPRPSCATSSRQAASTSPMVDAGEIAGRPGARARRASARWRASKNGQSR